MTHKRSMTAGERMTATERLALIRSTANAHRLTHVDLAHFTGYTHHSVAGWLTSCDSPRYRIVPARAVDRLQLELASGTVKGSK